METHEEISSQQEKERNYSRRERKAGVDKEYPRKRKRLYSFEQEKQEIYQKNKMCIRIKIDLKFFKIVLTIGKCDFKCKKSKDEA